MAHKYNPQNQMLNKYRLQQGQLWEISLPHFAKVGSVDYHQAFVRIDEVDSMRVKNMIIIRFHELSKTNIYYGWMKEDFERSIIRKVNPAEQVLLEMKYGS